MPLTEMATLLADAVKGGYAICYCESWNLESLEAVIQAAEELRSPTIAGFNGGFLLRPQGGKPANIAHYASLAALLRKATVPAAFLLNETDSLPQIEEAIDLGFTAVMPDNDHLEFPAYRELVKQVVKRAHRHGVSVEAQIGKLADASGHSLAQDTDPAAAKAFVEETGIDALAVAVGNVHILTTGKAPLDVEALARIHEQVKIPLVLHGGTGIPLEVATECIKAGVAKVNFGTVLKQVFLEAVREKLAPYHVPMSPHPFLGMGGEQDILMAGAEAVKREVSKLLHTFNSVGKAS